MSKFFLRSLCLASIVPLTACSSSSPNLATGPSAASTPAQQAYVPLPVARLALQIDNSGSTNAILGYSQIVFDGTASEGDGVTYSLEFGDGDSVADARAVHPCRKAGLLTARLTLTDRLGRTSTTSARYPCVGLVHPQGQLYSLTYGWTNSTFNSRLSRSEFRRLGFESQNGAAVSGFYTHPEGDKSHFTGSLSGDRTLTLRLDDGTITFVGDVLVRDSFTDTSYTENRNLLLVMRGGSVDGNALRFTYSEPF